MKKVQQFVTFEKLLDSCINLIHEHAVVNFGANKMLAND